MVICGHIHGAFGIACIELEAVKDVRDVQQICWEGYSSSRISKALWSKAVEMHIAEQPRQTLVVNAAFAPSTMSSSDKDAIGSCPLTQNKLVRASQASVGKKGVRKAQAYSIGKYFRRRESSGICQDVCYFA